MANEKLKEKAGKEAAKLVKDGMTVGLGTGSTVFYTLKALKDRKIKGICTSKDTEKKAKKLGIEIIPFEKLSETDIDIAIDGADEVDKDLNLTKGGGGALTREKMVDYKAEKFVVVVDESKLVELLGDFPLPVEVEKEKVEEVKEELKKIGARPELRGEKKPFVTDNGNYILDAEFDAILKPERLEKLINKIEGVVENGIFRREKVEKVLVGTENGVDVLK